MATPQEMWEALPPITKAWLGCSVVCTALVSFGSVSAERLFFYVPLIVQQFEIWRVFTCFVFFGKFSFNFLIQMFILSRFSAAMEADPFKTSNASGTADYGFSLLIMGFLALFAAWFMNIFFPGPILVFSVLYLWSKRNPEAPTNIWGFRFKGAMLPWALIAFNVLIGGNPMNDVIGVFVGHVFYFLVDIYPRKSGNDILRTPDFVVQLFDGAPAPGPGNYGGGRAFGGGYNWGGGAQRLGTQ